MMVNLYSGRNLQHSIIFLKVFKKNHLNVYLTKLEETTQIIVMGFLYSCHNLKSIQCIDKKKLFKDIWVLSD